MRRLVLSAECSAVRIAHPAIADRPEEAALAEGAEITAHCAWSFTAAPQRQAVSRRRRTLLHTIFVLDKQKKEEAEKSSHGTNPPT